MSQRIYPKIALAQLVVESCHHFNIKHVIISPGSRNAPLTVGFTAHPNIKTYSIVDERCAAFVALGMAQQLQEPVAVVCTSGSAVVNYYPAVLEAYYSNISLIVISTDRPKHMIDIGDGQTIRQENVFGSHTLLNCNLQESNDTKSQITLLKKAFLTAKHKSGPVHINVPFDEPLYESTTDPFLFDFDNKPNFDTENTTPLNGSIRQFSNTWNQAQKKLVIVGTHFPDNQLQSYLQKLIEDPSVLVFTENTSNVQHPDFINNIDQLLFPLNDEALKSLQPDIVLTIGGMLVSKRIKTFVRQHQPQHHWHVGKHVANDVFQCLSHHFNITATTFFNSFFENHTKKESDYQQKWVKTKNEFKQNHSDYLNNIEFSDLKVFDTIISQLPENTHLQLANSTVVRYAQLFDLPKSTQVFSNRGTSGIDGSTSTAVGAAMINCNQTVFISGDLSFFYDSNGLWNQYLPNNFRIVVINNRGGGIFRFIPGPSTTNALDYFETPHQFDTSHLCKMHRISYAAADNLDNLNSTLQDFYLPTNTPKLLEIFTPATINDQVLKAYFNSLKLKTIPICQ